MKKKHLSDKAAINGMLKTRILLNKMRELTNKPVKYLLHDMAEREYKRLYDMAKREYKRLKKKKGMQ